MSAVDDFLAKPCYCGHSRLQHRRPDGREPTARCRVCGDSHFYATPEVHARRQREAAFRADPMHVHERTHTAYACPGFKPIEVCDDCGVTVAR